MNRFKYLAVMGMYVYIFMMAVSANNILSAILIIVLLVMYIKICAEKNNYLIEHKRNLLIQREYFVNLLSHDLRIPTIAQIRALDLLKSERLGSLNFSQKDMIMQIEDSCKCILNLMSLMINTYGIENNTYKLIYEKFNISDVIVSCFNELLPQAAEKKITFEYKNNIKNNNFFVTADKTEIKKVILNIMSTSIMHTHYGEMISVILSSAKNKIKITITGNNEEYISCDNDANPIYTSVGQNIRLGFCKKIIETHKGKIFENLNKNCFSFELPKTA